ncbi:hypothetical protein CFP56_023614 [Quercus suber]|uniref:Uncharacterized protein n=1 Tax=Quercus suber TaxID=58331 RepID=A0AAW0K812_QUESU
MGLGETKRLTKLLNAYEGSVKCKHLNKRSLEGIQYDYKEKHEYNLKDLQPKRRKPPFDSDMFYIEGLIKQQFEALQKAFKIPHMA